MAKWWKWKIHWKLNLWPWSLQLPLWQRCDRWLPDRMPLVGRKCLIIYTHFCSFVLRDLRQKWVMIISVKTKTWKQKQHTWSKLAMIHNSFFGFYMTMHFHMSYLTTTQDTGLWLLLLQLTTSVFVEVLTVPVCGHQGCVHTPVWRGCHVRWGRPSDLPSGCWWLSAVLLSVPSATGCTAYFNVWGRTTLISCWDE